MHYDLASAAADQYQPNECPPPKRRVRFDSGTIFPYNGGYAKLISPVYFGRNLPTVAIGIGYQYSKIVRAAADSLELPRESVPDLLRRLNAMFREEVPTNP